MDFLKPITVQELAQVLDTNVAGDATLTISGMNVITEAVLGEATFVVNPVYKKYLATTKATVVIGEIKDLADCPAHITKMVTDNPRLALAKLVKLCVNEQKLVPTIHNSAVIGENCNIANNVTISANCVIANNVVLKSGVQLGAGVVIGNDCVLAENVELKANVTLYHNVKINQNTCIHSGSVVGADGFGYANDHGKWVKMLHLGGVTIGANVEIGSNTTIDRGFLADTLIADNVIIDNLVQIGHNVTIGSGTAIAGCVGIAGSAAIGENCLIGGGAGIGGHINIIDNVIITATSAVNSNITKPGVYSSGFPAKENSLWRKNVARFQFIDSMSKRIRQLESKVSTINN